MFDFQFKTVLTSVIKFPQFLKLRTRSAACFAGTQYKWSGKVEIQIVSVETQKLSLAP